MTGAGDRDWVLRLVDWLEKPVVSVDDECVGMSGDGDWSLSEAWSLDM